jgi:hypothetical protein
MDRRMPIRGTIRSIGGHHADVEIADHKQENEMLAQNFKTAADLGIKDIDLDALIKVLGMLERRSYLSTGAANWAEALA